MLVQYYVDGFYKEDFSFKPEIISTADYYLCERVQSVTTKFKSLLEEKFNVHRVYYIMRSCTECTFIFGAIKDKKFDNSAEIYRSTINAFEEFCVNFVDYFLEIIKNYNPAYNKSFILTNGRLRRAVIMGGYPEEERLTEREKECLWWVSKGKSTKKIAKILNLSSSTVETHNKNIRTKLNCPTIVEAVVEGIQRGLIGKFNAHTQSSAFNDFKIISNMKIAQEEIAKTNLTLLNSI